MQVSVEKISNVERRLDITVPSDRVEQEYNKQIQTLAAKSNIKGFRPGKVPLSYITQHFGDKARQEALNAVIQEALLEAIKQHNIHPINMPKIEPKTLMAMQPLEFSASFEVLPEVGPISFQLATVEKFQVDVTTEDEDQVIRQLQKQFTKWHQVEREAQLHDRVVIDYDAVEEGGVTIDPIKQYPLELGSQSMIPGFEEALLGTKIGEQKVVQLNFPDNYGIKEKIGKAVTFNVTVKQIFVAEAPQMDESFVKQLGVQSGDMADLRRQIRESLEKERDRLVNQKLKEQLFENLLTHNQIDVPQSLIEREAKNIHDEIYPQHQHQENHHHAENELKTFNEIAKKRVMVGLIIAEYAKQNHIKPSKEKVIARIQEIAAYYQDPQQVIKYLSENERRAGIESQVVEDQVMEKLLENVPVEEKRLSFAELKNFAV